MKPIIGYAVISGMWIFGPALAADAPSYPSKAVRLIAPSSPGSGVDTVSRLIAQKLAASLGQQVIVENRAGAGGNLGAEIAAKAAPDGYTLFMATPSHTINPALYQRLSYDVLKDFSAVSLATMGQYVLVVHPSLPAKSVKDLVALAKARPGQLNYASAGNGNATHLAGELLKSLAGINIVHVAYKGSGPALVDLISGQVHFMFPNLVNSLPHIQSGRLRALGVTGAVRTAAAPGIPTLIEAGVPGYTVTSWYGLLAPAATPQAIISRLSGEMVKAMRAPDLKDRLAGQGAEPAAGTPAEFHAFLKDEIAKWGKVVKAANISAE